MAAGIAAAITPRPVHIGSDCRNFVEKANCMISQQQAWHKKRLYLHADRDLWEIFLDVVTKKGLDSIKLAGQGAMLQLKMSGTIAPLGMQLLQMALRILPQMSAIRRVREAGTLWLISGPGRKKLTSHIQGAQPYPHNCQGRQRRRRSCHKAGSGPRWTTSVATFHLPHKTAEPFRVPRPGHGISALLHPLH